MKKILLVSSALLGVCSITGYTRRRRGSDTRHKIESSVGRLTHKVGMKFKGTPPPAKPPSLKKKIVVFSSLGGGGHTSVSKGLCGYLEQAYDVKIVNAIKTVLSPVDTMATVTFGKVTGEDLYNFMLRCGWTNLCGSFALSGRSYMDWRHGTMVKLLRDFLAEEQPALVISVVPHMNRAFLEICQELDIPFLIITNDLDGANYVHGLAPPYYKKFKYTIPFDDQAVRDKVKHAQFTDDMIVVTGFPLRPEFYQKKKVEKLKKDFKIPPDKPVVMVFMGGAGSQASYRYVRILARLKIPMHIIVCLGRNERLKRNIRKIQLPPGITTTLMGYTDRIADIMAMSDLVITKPGPNSVCEALQSEVPMILDEANGAIFWERLNIDFMVKHGFAESLKDYGQIDTMLPKYFQDTEFTDAVKKKMREFAGVRYDQTIKPLVDEMVAMGGDQKVPSTA